jgi:predicted dinucleotide-binding enzyme
MPDEAARHVEVVILATLWAVALDILRAIAESLAGTILWDNANPLKPT